jgi:transcription termination factor Rho
MISIDELESKSKSELIAMAKEKGVPGYEDLNQQDLIIRLLRSEIEQDGHVFCSGILEIMADGYGFLRQDTLLPTQIDVYISPSQIRRFGLPLWLWLSYGYLS